jgi:hypothetical protein
VEGRIDCAARTLDNQIPLIRSREGEKVGQMKSIEFLAGGIRMPAFFRLESTAVSAIKAVA